jgi:C4-dicarboxylate transporter, DctM subunit
MEPFIGILGFVMILVLMAMGAHIAVAIGLPAIISLFFLLGVPQTFEVVASQAFRLATDYTFTAVPLFLLMGYLAMVSGITSSAFDAAALWLRRVPGGLAMAACVASIPIGACMGSGVPATVALSKMAIPEMISHKYNKSLASGTIAATATVSVLVPPSIMMVVYSIYTQVSLGKMLLAGYLPALISILVYVIYIGIRVMINPELAPQRSNEKISFVKHLKAIKGMWGITVLFLVLFGGIYTGYFTATEAAALAAFTACILMIVKRKFSWVVLRDGFTESIKTTAVLFILLISSVLFVVFIDVTGLPRIVSNAIVSADLSIYGFLGVIMFVYLIMGIFLPSIASLLLTLPILLPVMIELDINLIWFGILFIKMSEIGAITPPFGLSVFIVKGVVGDIISLGEIFRGIVWFVVLDLLTLILLIAFPIICLWLPNTMF